jgi:WD40 repeat protein
MNAAATTPTTRPLKLTSTSQTLPHGHLDYVLDVSFDHYGRRFATASGDRTNNNSGNSSQSNVNEWQAHRGPVNRISWAHPEFGQLLATAGAGE